MHSDLQHLIRLQQLDLATEEARRTIASVPERSAALDAELEHARTTLAGARERKTANETDRRAIEKDRSAVKVRRSKYQDQTMEVKTNREFHALQHEIEMADQEIARFDDRDLELMVQADEIAADIKNGETALKEAERSIAAQRLAMETESQEATAALDHMARERSALAARIPPDVLHLFQQIARTRKGLAVAAVRDGLCTVCQLRLRPQIYGEVRRNDRIIQCESCTRILYFVPSAPVGNASA
jgi:uncharacterized protein